MRWLLLPLAFLLGSIPFGFLLYRWRRGGDIRRSGSGNIGATNVLRTAGKKLGMVTLLLDACKGWVSVWLALHWGGGNTALIAACVFLVIAGHIFSPWLSGRGGKGVATALGAFLALAALELAGAVVVFVIVAVWWRYVSLASICACVALPLLLLIPMQAGRVAPVEAAVAAAAAALIIYRHKGNLARLRRGTESRLGTRVGKMA
ncbi:MAG: glycerol-3-phosphate 1-O-acyltransferase PlsY [Terriglobales bacterium]